MKHLSILRIPLLQHILFWLLYFTFNVLRWGFYFGDFDYAIASNLVEFPIHLILVYFNLYYLIPRLFPKRIAWYILSLALAITVVSYLRIILTYQLVTTEIWKESKIIGLELFDPNYFIEVSIGELYVVGVTMAIKLSIDYVNSLKITKELENKKLEAELSFLRSQIQPHFFFNTLNNLYSLTLTRSDKAPETVLKLADLMSYVIYKGKSKRVALHEEIKHLYDYLDLEKLRYGDRLQSSVEITGKIEDLYIPPLILLPFVENSFKHGDSDSGNFPIDIQISLNDLSLTYIIKNNLHQTNTDLISKDVREGIGLKNTIRRLDLLFKDQYNLEMKQDKTIFSVTLTMPLYDKLSDS